MPANRSANNSRWSDVTAHAREEDPVRTFLILGHLRRVRDDRRSDFVRHF